MRQDAESSLYYFRARYLDSSHGRFLSRDPVGFIAGFNLYANTFDCNRLDPAGLLDNCYGYSKAGFDGEGDFDLKLFELIYKYELNIEGQICNRCCPDGRKVMDVSMQVEAFVGIEARGVVPGLGHRFEVTEIEGFEGEGWYGILVHLGAEGFASAGFASDLCNNDDGSGEFCVGVRGMGGVSGGVHAHLRGDGMLWESFKEAMCRIFGKMCGKPANPMGWFIRMGGYVRGEVYGQYRRCYTCNPVAMSCALKSEKFCWSYCRKLCLRFG